MKTRDYAMRGIAVLLGFLLIVAVGLVGSHGGSARAETPGTRSNEVTVNNEDALVNALQNLVPRDSTPFTIYVGTDFLINSDRVKVSANQNVTITSDDLPHVLTRDPSYTGNLFFVGEPNATGATNAILTITNLVLDGNEYTDQATASIIASHHGTLNLGQGAVVKSNLMTVTGAPGSGVVVNGGTLNMYEDALISGNLNLGSKGGGLYCYNGCTANIYGNAEIAGNTVQSDGGGVVLDGSTLNLFESAKIRSNHALRGHAGGIDNNGGTLNIYDDAEVSDNHAETVAGGIYTTNGGKTNTYGNARLQDNTAVTSAAGALLTGATSELNISGSAAISGNHSSGNGGGISVLTGTATISDSAEVSNNAADASGGGIANLSGTLDITDDASILDNYSGDDGAGVYSAAPTSLSGNVTIQGNATEHNGGGIAVGGSTRLAVAGATLTNNTANNDGGAVHVGESAELRAIDTVFRENRAGGDGGAIFAAGKAFKTLTTDGVAFTDNSAIEGHEWELDGDEVSRQHERNIINTSYTTPFTNAYNNYDISYSRPLASPGKPSPSESPLVPSTPPVGPSTPPVQSSTPPSAPPTEPSTSPVKSGSATPSGSVPRVSSNPSGAPLPHTGGVGFTPSSIGLVIVPLLIAGVWLLALRRHSGSHRRPIRLRQSPRAATV
jgi:predicted outer membrane repeat protein